MARYGKLISTPAPVTEQVRADQVKNSTGGFTFALTPQKQLERFLILGSDAPTYYASAQKLTRENARVVEKCWIDFPEATADTVIDVSDKNRAPRNDPAIFALALGMVSTNPEARQEAARAVYPVCRTATHLFTWMSYCRLLGKGNGRIMKRTIANWYAKRPTEALARQMVQYQNRAGFTHKRGVQLSNMGAGEDAARVALYNWACGREFTQDNLPPIVQAMAAAHGGATVKQVTKLITDHNLPWEALPTEMLKVPEIWGALLPKMGLTALIRNLGRMTSIGTVASLNAGTKEVVARLGDAEALKKARIHPFTLLNAMSVYKGGTSLQGGRRGVTTQWSPVQAVIAALNEAFYASFANIVPSGKATMLALDISGSMGGGNLFNSKLTPREGTAAMAMVTLRTEQMAAVYGFGNTFHELKINKGMSLETVLKTISGLPFGSTNCSLPFTQALSLGIPVETFVVYTDNEVNTGRHPYQALRDYRQKTGINAKLVVVGMTATQFSIADPSDDGMLDVVGFDSSAPAVIADFVR